VSTSTLQLFRTGPDTTCIWEKRLPNPAKATSLSFDSAYVATIGYYDSIVKVWRRLNYGADEVRFDMACLPHPQTVTAIRWRKPYHVEQTIENVLYTTCLDLSIRVWVGSDVHSGLPLYLKGKVDISWSIQQQALANTISPQPWVFFVDGRDVTAAAENAIQRTPSAVTESNAAIERLVGIASNNSELCFVYGGGDTLSVLALENVGSKSPSLSVTSIAHIESKDWTLRTTPASPESSHVEIQAYCARRSGHLRILVHEFHGMVKVFETDLVELIDPNVPRRHIHMRCSWSGHSAPIQKIVRNFSGRAVVSRTAGGESIVWSHSDHSVGSPVLSRQCVIPDLGHIHRICVLRKGRFVAFLTHDSICLWDCRAPQARLLGRQSYQLRGKPLCLLILPRSDPAAYHIAHIATVSSEQDGVVWEIRLPLYASQGTAAEPHEPSIHQFCTFDLAGADGLAYVLPVDPAGAAPVTTGFLDIFAKDVAISYTHSGRVTFWTARVEQVERRVEWLSTSHAETGLDSPALVSGSTLKKAALVDSSRSQLFIWDIGGARLEYSQDYGAHHTIRDLDWTSTPDSQSILAVGFQSRVILLSQMRFDYLNKGPAWAQIREISIREQTPRTIGDSTWLGDGHLVIGAGNQLFVEGRSFGQADPHISTLRLPHKKEGTWDLFEAVQRFNGPLPVFHPQFLSQSILSGKTTTVQRILMALHQTLKYHIPGENIDDYLGLNMSEFYTSEVSSAVFLQHCLCLTRAPYLVQTLSATSATGLLRTARRQGD
jgi:rabconnectin-3a